MNYNIRHFSAYFVFLFMFLGFKAHAQELEPVYIVPNNPLITKIIELKDFNTTISLSPESNALPLGQTMLAANGQLIIKNGKDIYILIQQTGFTYKLTNYDSATCEYTRLDHTINLNYNINCKPFFYQNQLYSFGGYGFWKNNGHLRKFSFEDSEWDIMPVSKEIFATQLSWFDAEKGRLYVPFQRTINAGLEGPENIKGVPDYASYYLDLKTRKWEKVGDLEKTAREVMVSESETITSQKPDWNGSFPEAEGGNRG